MPPELRRRLAESNSQGPSREEQLLRRRPAREPGPEGHCRGGAREGPPAPPSFKGPAQRLPGWFPEPEAPLGLCWAQVGVCVWLWPSLVSHSLSPTFQASPACPPGRTRSVSFGVQCRRPMGRGSSTGRQQTLAPLPLPAQHPPAPFKLNSCVKTVKTTLLPP